MKSYLIAALKQIISKSTELNIEIFTTDEHKSEHYKINKHHVFNYEDLLEAILYPGDIKIINFYDNDMNLGNTELANQLKKDLPAGIDIKPYQALKIKIQKSFESGEKPAPEKEFESPHRQEFERLIKEERSKEKPKFKSVK